MIPLAIDLQPPQTTPQQTLIAIGVLVAIFVGLVIFGYRARYAGLPGPLGRDKATLQGARADAQFSTFRFPGDTDFRSPATRRRLDRLTDPQSTVDRTTARDAVAEVKRALGDAWAPYIMALPRPARWLLGLAANITIFGAVAVSTGLLLRLLRADPRPIQPLATWPSTAASQTAAVLDLAGALLFQIPGLRLVWSLVFSMAVLLWTFLYSHWYLVAAILAFGAVMIAVLERHIEVTPGGVEADVPPARRAARLFGGGAMLVWLSMLVGIGLGRRFISDQAGVYGGLIYGSAACIVIICLLAVKTVRRLRDARGWVSAFRDQQLAAQVLTLIRLGWLGVAAVLSPLLPVYVLVTLTKLPVLIGAYLSAAPEIQTLGAVLTAALLAALAWQARAAWDEVWTALVELGSQQQIRALVLGTGIPAVAVAFGYIVTYAFVRSIVIAATVAVLLGLLVRGVYRLAIRVKYRASLGRSGPSPARRVVVQTAPLQDDSGDTHWYARVNGDTELLHPDREGLIDALVEVGDDLTTVGRVDPTVAEWHARFAFRVGVTSIAETRDKLREKVRKRLYTHLRREDRLIPTRDLERRLDTFPEEVRESRIDKEIYLGNLRWGPRYVELRNDPLQS